MMRAYIRRDQKQYVLGAMVVPIPIVSTKQNSVKAALAMALILVLY